MRSSLLRVLPQPTVLTIRGVEYQCTQLTVGDLAALQAMVEGAYPHPLEAMRSVLPGLEPRDRDQALLAIYREAKTSLPCVWGPEWTKYYGTVVGCAMFLRLVLGKGSPTEDLLALAESMTPEELAAVQRVAYGVDPQEEVETLLQMEGDSVAVEPRDEWDRMVDCVARSHGLSYEEVGKLSLSQFNVALSKGERRDRSRAVRPGEDLAELVRKRREHLGLDAEVTNG